MELRFGALALLALVACAGAYTVDCNHEYTDCDTELSKITEDDETSMLGSATTEAPATTTPQTTTTTTAKLPTTTAEQPKPIEPPEVKDEKSPQARLLNINVDDLQNFADALHNRTQDKSKVDLSDVNLDDDDDEPPKLEHDKTHNHDKQISDKFYTNLQAPFNPMAAMASEETDMCKENGLYYKVGEHIERMCEESCECTAGGVFDCSPRCKHPYIRRGRRLMDPLCFESPVDECCSIVACATGNGETVRPQTETCRYGNDTYPVGSTWNIGCEQRCLCEKNSIITCKPRCNMLPQSDKCINVQDPNDACCEVQICDVSQDAHEETVNDTSSTPSTTTEVFKGFADYTDLVKSTMRPLVLVEPIGSIKVLQNNSVQVNLMHLNSTEDPVHLLLSDDGGKNFEDVELKYSNLILNLPGGKDYILKTKETGTKFNFTITQMSENIEDNAQNGTGMIGCHHDGHFYAVGEEFHIGCSQLCECTGPETKECAELVCPSHVGLELVSKGCVRWAPSPPAQPPNCCPRAARCLSDGTCYFKGVAVPNWSEVPITMTGCEQRCFCENGELDCQEVCSPLPPVPPQSLRCPPHHHPAPVNISDEDCCKHWQCVPNPAEDTNPSTFQTYNEIMKSYVNYVTPVAPITPTTPTIHLPPVSSDPTEFYRHLHPVKSYPKILKTITQNGINEPQQYSIETPNHRIVQGDNITVFTLDDIESPFKTIQADPTLASHTHNYKPPHPPPHRKITESIKNIPYSPSYTLKPAYFLFSDQAMHNIIDPLGNKIPSPQTEKPKKIPMSEFDDLNYFVPAFKSQQQEALTPHKISAILPQSSKQSYFSPMSNFTHFSFPTMPKNNPNEYKKTNEIHGNHLLKLKDIKNRNQWGRHPNPHILMKEPNPYENVLLRPVPYTATTKLTRLGSKQSPLDLDQLVNQMEVESEVNRNLERSADKENEGLKGHTQSPEPPKTPRPPPSPFFPTIPPGIHFPTEEIPDYGNTVHRPVNSANPIEPELPPEIPVSPNFGEANKKLSVITLQADSPTSVKMLFGLPPVLVGLRGSVDLRYTDKFDEDVSQWYSQVFAPADEVLTTPRLEFRLTGLKPSTTYKIRGKLYLHNLPVEPESEVYSVRTQDLPTVMPVEEKRREVDSRLTVVDVNDTAAHVSWRHFTEDELQYIDGVQVRYRPVGTPIYSMTELLHHSRTVAELHDLRPGSRYEASLILIPPPRSTTELHDPGRVEFTTSPYVDPYNWSITIEARSVGSDAAEVTWRGVPSPAERWVRVYRAAHVCGATRKEHDAFRLAARDLPSTILLTGLQADTRCRVWLELFLTNGKVKTSNVLEINTKSQDTPSEIDNEISASGISGSAGARGRGDYYGALVVVGVVAALGALTSLLLLLVLLRRHRPRSVAITAVPSAPRESSLPPYDNPAYKLELQQETMDL